MIPLSFFHYTCIRVWRFRDNPFGNSTFSQPSCYGLCDMRLVRFQVAPAISAVSELNGRIQIGSLVKFAAQA